MTIQGVAIDAPARTGSDDNDIMVTVSPFIMGEAQTVAFSADGSGYAPFPKVAAAQFLTDRRGWSLNQRRLRFWGDWPQQRGRVFIDHPEGGKVLIDWRKAKKLKRKGVA